MKMTTCSMSVNLEQTDGAGTAEVATVPHPGRSTAAISAAAVAAPILNNSRRVTFLEGMGGLSPSFHCVGSAKRPATPLSGRSYNESSLLQKCPDLQIRLQKRFEREDVCDRTAQPGDFRQPDVGGDGDD